MIAVVVPPSADPRDRLAGSIPKLRAFAISLARDSSRADDLVQETILKAWSNIEKFDPATNLDAWLFTILRNTFYSSLRKTRREVQDSDGAHAATLSVKPAHDGRLAMQEFQKAFDALSPEHREVLILVGASGFSCEEAAGMMGVAGPAGPASGLPNCCTLKMEKTCSREPMVQRRRSCSGQPQPGFDPQGLVQGVCQQPWGAAGLYAHACSHAAWRAVHRPDPRCIGPG